MKKIVLGLLVFTLVGCSKQNDTETTESSTTVTSTQTSSTSTVASSSQTDANSSTETTASENSTTTSTEYGVSIADLGSVAQFNFTGMNVPDSIILAQDGAESTATFTFQQGAETIIFNTDFETIPTKEIRIFSADRSGVRTVKVNTAVILSELPEVSYTRNLGEKLYLFTNADGGISLATPNYAGNVTADQADVMIEVLQ